MALCNLKRQLYCGWFLLFIGVLACLSAVFVPPALNTLLENGLDDLLVLTEDDYHKNTKTWQNWADTQSDGAVAPDFIVYMFNITNPEEILAGGPVKVTEHGPYYYTQQTYRFNISFGTDDNYRKTVTFKEWNRWVFNRDKTPAQLSDRDIFTGLNGAFIEAASAFLDLPDILYQLYPSKSAVSKTFTDMTRLFATHTVNETIWGYFDPQLQEASVISGGAVSGTYDGLLGPNITSLDACNYQIWEYPSQCGFNTLLTGENQPYLAQQYYSWQSQTSLLVQDSSLNSTIIPLWGTDWANLVSGTPGNSFHKHIDPDESLVVFIPSLLRRVSFQNLNHETYSVHDIELRKFYLAPETWQNDTVVPRNAAYFQNVSGVMDQSRAWLKIPTTLTQPHFLDADSSVQSMVQGLSPDAALHGTYLGVEPTSGLSLDAHARFQVNFKLWPMFINDTRSPETWFANIIPGLIVPNCWVDLSAQISSSLATDFRNEVYLAQGLAYYTYWVASIVGAAFIFLGAFLVHKNAKQQGKEESTFVSETQKLLQ